MILWNLSTNTEEYKFNGHAYLLYPHAARELVGDNLLLVGDAAGLAYAKSGEGIRPAVESGLLAAAVIRNCNGDYSKKKLALYRSNIQLRFGQRAPERERTGGIALLIKKAMAHQLLQMRWFIKNMVIDRWFLQTQQKRLADVSERR